MYRQKGTGNARAGSRRTNVRRGGGHAFARRQSRLFIQACRKKAMRLATRMAMAGKIQSEQVLVIDESVDGCSRKPNKLRLCCPH